MAGTRTGRFVVIEGIDGAGTTTQVGLLAGRLRREGHTSVCATREPTDGPFGVMIRQVLTGRLVATQGRAPGWATMALLFAADRMDHSECVIEPAVASGGIVISDRYDASSLAYQSVSSGANGADAVEWIRSLNRYAFRPDLTIVLDVSAEVAASRRAQRGEPAQLYEQNEVQRALSVFYKNLQGHMPNDRVVLVDAHGDVNDVHQRVYDVVRSVLMV